MRAESDDQGGAAMHRVLVLGERPEESKALAFDLNLRGFDAVASSGDSTAALQSQFTFGPDAIVLDLNSGGTNQELLRTLHWASRLPIVVLTDDYSESDLVWHLEAGAAAYLAKPLGPETLCAHLTAVIRRAGEAQSGRIKVRDLELDLDRSEVWRRGKIVSLGRTGFNLLRILAENKGRPCSHRLLLENVWGPECTDCRHYLRLYIWYLRNKLEDDPRNPTLLVTVWGVGYRLVEPPERVHPSGSLLPLSKASLTCP